MSFAQTINGMLRHVPAWPLYFIGVVPAFWYLYLGLTGGLGAEPINALELKLGRSGLQFLIVVMAITPLRRFTGISLIKYRRALGLLVFFYISVHLLTWLVLDVGVVGQIWKDIVKRPFITIGMTGFALMLPVAITSNNLSIRKLGPKVWKRLHQLSYVIAVLGPVHFIMVQKLWEAEPMIYLGLVAALLAVRLKWKTRHASVGVG